MNESKVDNNVILPSIGVLKKDELYCFSFDIHNRILIGSGKYGNIYMWKLLMKNISAFSENRNKSQETDWLCLEPIINPNLNKDTGEVTEKSNVALIQWGSGKLKNKNRRCI